MPTSDEKITKVSTIEENIELSELLKSQWSNRKVVAIVKDKRNDGDYWVLIYST